MAMLLRGGSALGKDAGRTERPRVKTTRSVGCSEEARVEKPRWRWHTEENTHKKTPFKSILSLQHAGSVPQAFPKTRSPDPRPKLSVWRFLLLP